MPEVVGARLGGEAAGAGRIIRLGLGARGMVWDAFGFPSACRSRSLTSVGAGLKGRLAIGLQVIGHDRRRLRFRRSLDLGLVDQLDEALSSGKRIIVP